MANIMRLGGGGKKAEGEIPITANGIYDVAEYASANVNVQSAPVLLWENASPASSFGGTVTLATGYDAYIIEAMYAYYGGSITDDILLFHFFNSNRGAVTFFAVKHSTGAQQYRGITVSGNTIDFSSSTYNAKPRRIWGVKFTL